MGLWPWSKGADADLPNPKHRRGEEILNAAFGAQLPAPPLPPLIKFQPPPPPGHLRGRIHNYGVLVGLADGGATQFADAAFESHVDVSIATAEALLASETARI